MTFALLEEVYQGWKPQSGMGMGMDINTVGTQPQSTSVSSNVYTPDYYAKINSVSPAPLPPMPPSSSSVASSKSDIVPYNIKFPENANRNAVGASNYSVSGVEDNIDDELSMVSLEDNDEDILNIDKERNISSTEGEYYASKDYFLYKKYQDLAEKYQKLSDKYKRRLRLRYKSISMDLEGNVDGGKDKEVIEGFNFNSSMDDARQFKDVAIFIILGIFIIFALDIFVRLGGKMKN